MASRGGAAATPSVATAAATPSAITVATPAVTADVPAVAATGGGGGGAIQAAPIVVPVVTFGSGRVPGIPSGRPEALPNAVGLSGGSAIVVVPAAPAPSVPVPVFASPAAVQRIEVPAAQLPSTFLWSPLRHTWPDAALFGLAGLLLAPVAGVWLGYRQARASKSAANIAGR